MKIRRFRFTLAVNTGSSARVSNGYWPRERTTFLHTFRPIAERYRRRRRTILYLLLGFMLGGVAQMYVNLPDAARIGGLILMTAALLGAVVTFAFGLRLRCPHCRKRLEPAKGT